MILLIFIFNLYAQVINDSCSVAYCNMEIKVNGVMKFGAEAKEKTEVIIWMNNSIADNTWGEKSALIINITDGMTARNFQEKITLGNRDISLCKDLEKLFAGHTKRDSLTAPQEATMRVAFGSVMSNMDDCDPNEIKTENSKVTGNDELKKEIEFLLSIYNI